MTVKPKLCRFCDLPILERRRNQRLHKECKELIEDRKRQVFLANQVLFALRMIPNFVVPVRLPDGVTADTLRDLPDDEVLELLGIHFSKDLICEPKKGGGFKFLGVQKGITYLSKDHKTRRQIHQRQYLWKYQRPPKTEQERKERELYARRKATVSGYRRNKLYRNALDRHTTDRE